MDALFHFESQRMTKGKHGNKEAKKPKKIAPTAGALVPPGTIPTVPPAAQDRQKRR